MCCCFPKIKPMPDDRGPAPYSQYMLMDFILRPPDTMHMQMLSYDSPPIREIRVRDEEKEKLGRLYNALRKSTDRSSLEKVMDSRNKEDQIIHKLQPRPPETPQELHAQNARYICGPAVSLSPEEAYLLREFESVGIGLDLNATDIN